MGPVKSSKMTKTGGIDNVGLPMSTSSDVLATKAAEGELRRRVQSLEAELRSATAALENLQKSGEAPAGQDAGELTLRPLTTTTSTSSIAPPPGKKGYLFKWLDRSIGWSGTKWALRFVTLENGRISYYGSHTDDSPRYVLNLRGCGVRDDGWKRNRRHVSKTKGDPPLDEAGAYFFLFSIYHRPDSVRDQDDPDDSEIVPLLRFSTPSHAERSQWIQLISEACAYCETDAFVENEASRVAELALQLQEQAQMASAMPEAKEGTLPPLYFAPGKVKHARHQSFSKLPSAKLFRTKSKNFDADKVDARSTKGYPPSKPMHRATAPSYLSVEAPVQNYRGFFNLGIIILLVSNFRLILGTVQRHGFVLNRVVQHYRDLPHISSDPWEEFPFVSGILLQLVFITISYAIEWLLSRKKLHESIGMILHQINAHCAFAVPMAIVWNFIDKPPIGATLLLHATITWMKLISYIHANEDYRLSGRQADVDSHTATLALVENLDPADENVLYPQNVTLRNMFYYWFAPTLTYQIAFPKSPRIRIWKIVGILVRMVGAVALFTFLAAQIVGPALEALVQDLEATNGTYTVGILADYWLRLSIANTYLWLLLFYFYFHLYLNLFAEILRFGDRVFYKDWWNSSEVSAYWRLWNMPVHYWLIRHVYFPCIRLKMSKVSATFVVFLLSAVMHEVLVSVPFHMVRPWSFLGMMMQMPLVAATKYLYRKYPGSSIGNFIFWMSFCVVGQPMAILLYTVDYQYGKHHTAALDVIEEEQCRIMWSSRCLVP